MASIHATDVGSGMSEAVAGSADARRMQAFAAGDMAAFEQLYALHKGGLFRYFLRSLSNRGLAEELAQDVWTSVIRAAADWRPDAKFTTWLYRLAHNRLIDHYRRRNLVVFTALEEEGEASSPAHEVPSTAPTPEEATDQRAAARRAVRLVETLPPAQREALLLQLEGGLSLEESAAATGAGFETVKSRLRYALARVREGLKEFQ